MKTTSILPLFLSLFLIIPELNGQSLSQVLEKRLETLKNQTAKERVFVLTDRDLYGPGEKIWLTALIYDIANPALSLSASSVYVRVYNSDQMEVFGKNFPVEKGIASGSLSLPADMTEDIYYLKGETAATGGPGLYVKKVLIKNKPLPPFIIEVVTPDKKSKPGDIIPLTLSFKDFYNEPLSNISYEIEFFDGNKKLSGVSGKIKKESSTNVSCTVPTSLTSGLLCYKITAQQKNRMAYLTGKLSTLSNKLFVEIMPENGKLIGDIPTTVNFFVHDATGEPVEAQGNIISRDVKLFLVSSNARGMGSFSFTPTYNAEFVLQLQLPGVGNLDFPLPAVQQKGMAMHFGEVNGNSINLKITNNHGLESPAVLIGESNSNIFHISEIKVGAELQMEVDISKAGNSMVHFILTNASAEIEAEQIMFIGSLPKGETIDPINANGVLRGKMAYEFADPSAMVMMSAVNQPWILSNLYNQQPWILALPYDLSEQITFRNERFLAGIFDDQLIGEYAKFYTPDLFSWSKVLNTMSPRIIYEIPAQITENEIILDKLKIHGMEVKKDDMVLHTNMNASPYFITTNPKYITMLFTEPKTENVPAYKKMLESGTPLIDVLQTIRPFKLEGSNIVFSGTNNSLLYQGGALIAIDGVNRGTDASILRNISPYEVDRIFVSTNPNDIQRYTGLNSVGIIEIWLKRGEITKAATPASGDDENTFSDVNHDGQKDSNADYRSTLHWSCGHGTSSVKWRREFFNSDLLSSVLVQFYVIPPVGIPVMFQDSYKVESK